jgi:hypothetical protein
MAPTPTRVPTRRAPGALRPADGHVATLTGRSRDSAGYQQLLAEVATANPTGAIAVVTDSLSTHDSASTRACLLAQAQPSSNSRPPCQRRMWSAWVRRYVPGLKKRS